LVAAGRNSAATPGGLNSKKGGTVLIFRMAAEGRRMGATQARPAGRPPENPVFVVDVDQGPKKSIS